MPWLPIQSIQACWCLTCRGLVEVDTQGAGSSLVPVDRQQEEFQRQDPATQAASSRSRDINIHRNSKYLLYCMPQVLLYHTDVCRRYYLIKNGGGELEPTKLVANSVLQSHDGFML